jgi:predicted RNase H-like nuclease
MINIGVDSCPGGWIAVIYTPFLKHYKIAKTFLELFNENWFKEDFNDQVLCLVDIPIGLCDEQRKCDSLARSVLGKRSSSVFSTPVYDAVYSDTYIEAKEANFKLTGKYISKQAWNICPKIRDVNNSLEKFNSKIIVREMHPEVCFWALNEKNPCQHYKKTTEGKLERLKILSKHCPDAESLFYKILTEVKKKIVNDDDIIDALVGVVTAKTEKLTYFPHSIIQKGRNGYISEMVFYDEKLEK